MKAHIGANLIQFPINFVQPNMGPSPPALACSASVRQDNHGGQDHVLPTILMCNPATVLYFAAKPSDWIKTFENTSLNLSTPWIKVLNLLTFKYLSIGKLCWRKHAWTDFFNSTTINCSLSWVTHTVLKCCRLSGQIFLTLNKRTSWHFIWWHADKSTPTLNSVNRYSC